MRRFFIIPLSLITLACTSSQYVTKNELHDLLTLPPSDEPTHLQRADLDALVAGAFSAPNPPARAASALAATDQKMAPLTDALAAIDQAFDVCSNNLANAQTTGYKRRFAVTNPAGESVFRYDFEQGSLESTSRQLDLAIQGHGFFKIRLAKQSESGYAYSRNGNFFVNHDGRIVLGMGDDYELQPAIAIPAGTTDVSISADGHVTVTEAGASRPVAIGQLELYHFTSPEGLKLLGGTLFAQTPSSGSPIESKPGENGVGQIIQGFLESSNVDPTKERLRIRFLQNWRATILHAIEDSKPEKPTQHSESTKLNQKSDAAITAIQSDELDPIVAAAQSTPESVARPRTTIPSDHGMAPLVTALAAIDVEYSVCANNLANATTTAFKSTRVNLQDIQPRSTSTKGDVSPAGITFGSGVKVANTQLNTGQGALQNTGRQLDIGIQGQGFLKIRIAPNSWGGPGYTRNGNLFINKDGDLVVGKTDGYAIEPKITVPKGITDISISSDGKIAVSKGGDNFPTMIGRLELCQFVNPQGLDLLGGSLFLETASSGPALQSKPGDNGAGQLLQGFLESSNVNPMQERMRIRALQNWRATVMQVINDAK